MDEHVYLPTMCETLLLPRTSDLVMNRVVSALFVYGLVSASLLHAAPPPAPTGFEASDSAFGNKVALSWEHVRGAQIYRVYRSATNDPATAESIGVTESVLYADLVGTNESYFYWVQAIGADGAGPFSAADRGATGPSASPFGGVIVINGLPTSNTPQPPTANQVTGAKVFLGKTLFWDEQLSSTRTTACGTCHRFSSGGSDPRAGKGAPNATNPGLDGIIGTDDDVAGSRGVPLTRSDGSYQWSKYGVREQITDRRASSIVDSAFAPQGVLWDGKPGAVFNDPATAKPVFGINAALEAQALLPFLNTTEMAHDGRTLADVVARIRDSRPLALSPSIPPALAQWIGTRSYEELFEEAFGTPGVTPIRLAMAIASYERTLIADRTPLDGTITQGLAAGVNALGRGRCTVCHSIPVTTNGQFRVTGVRPPTEDRGRGSFSTQPQDLASFRTPSLRNAGLRTGMFHNGNATIEDSIEFYNRGGDFKESPGFLTGIMQPLNLTAEEKLALGNLLRYQLVDQRVAQEKGPIFDRPWLYSESARVPAIVGSGVAVDGAAPQPIALEPPFLGNPRYTIALDNVPPGARAVLLIDRTDPGAATAVPTGTGVIRREVTTSDGGFGKGYASVTMALPGDTAMTGVTLHGRWYVITSSGVAVSPEIRLTLFSLGAGTETLTSFSAATLVKGRVARDSIVSSFGTGLAASTVVAQGALETTLGGVRVSITDASGTSTDAPIYFVSAGQINYVIPANVAEGEAKVEVIRDGTTVATGVLQIAGVAPGIFTGNSDGRDAAAALVQRVTSSGASAVAPSSRLDTALQRVVPQPIDLGSDTDQLFLQLYATGLRNAPGLTATIGGLPADVLFSGAQPQFPGMDQVNLRIPRQLAGRGEVEVILTAGEVRSNIVRIAIR